MYYVLVSHLLTRNKQSAINNLITRFWVISEFSANPSSVTLKIWFVLWFWLSFQYLAVVPKVWLRKLDESCSLRILLKLNLCLSLVLENEITLLTGQNFVFKRKQFVPKWHFVLQMNKPLGPIHLKDEMLQAEIFRSEGENLAWKFALRPKQFVPKWQFVL